MKSQPPSLPDLSDLLIFSDWPEDCRIAEIQLAHFPRLLVAATLPEFVVHLAELPSTIAMAVAVTSKPSTQRRVAELGGLKASERLMHVHFSNCERIRALDFFCRRTHEKVSPEEVFFSRRPDCLNGGFEGIYMSLDWRTIVANAATELERALCPTHQ